MSVLNCFNITNFAWVLITLRWHILQNFQRKIISSIHVRITINNLQNNWNKIHIVYISFVLKVVWQEQLPISFTCMIFRNKQNIQGNQNPWPAFLSFMKILYNYFTMNNYFPGLKIINTKGSCHRFGFFL